MGKGYVRHERYNRRNPDRRRHHRGRSIRNPERGGTSKRISERADEVTISHELRQLSAAIDYLSRKRGELLDDLKAHPEKHGCPYRIGQEFKTQDGAVYKVEKINVLTYPSADGLCAYYQAQAVNQNKPHDRKEYTVQIK